MHSWWQILSINQIMINNNQSLLYHKAVVFGRISLTMNEHNGMGYFLSHLSEWKIFREKLSKFYQLLTWPTPWPWLQRIQGPIPERIRSLWKIDWITNFLSAHDFSIRSDSKSDPASIGSWSWWSCSLLGSVLDKKFHHNNWSFYQ